MHRWTLACIAALTLALAARDACAQLEPVFTYFGVNRPAPVRVTIDPPSAPLPTGSAPRVELVLYDPTTERVVDRAFIVRGSEAEDPAGAEEVGGSDRAGGGWTVDLASVFPILWTARQPRLLYAQLVVDSAPVGAPVVLEPLLNPRRFDDRLSRSVLDAFARRDAAELTRLLALSSKARDEMAFDVSERPSDPVFSGRRAYVLRDVVLETSEGEMRIALVPAAAPGAVFRFLSLAEGGFYRDMAFHRVISADASGLPFLVQTGDPTGTGRGGSGALAPFERSPMAHARGVVSMARLPDDPNSNGAQFFICLGRSACSKLDGRYTSFGRVVEGFDTLDAIAATPLAPAEEEGQPIAQRPISPPVLLGATPVDAAPIEIDRPVRAVEETPPAR